jgi:hypothetical protein
MRKKVLMMRNWTVKESARSEARPPMMGEPQVVAMVKML